MTMIVSPVCYTFFGVAVENPIDLDHRLGRHVGKAVALYELAGSRESAGDVALCD